MFPGPCLSLNVWGICVSFRITYKAVNVFHALNTDELMAKCMCTGRHTYADTLAHTWTDKLWSVQFSTWITILSPTISRLREPSTSFPFNNRSLLAPLLISISSSGPARHNCRPISSIYSLCLADYEALHSLSSHITLPHFLVSGPIMAVRFMVSWRLDEHDFGTNSVM